MSYKKTIICLASSWKHARGSGRCIAGREVGTEGFGSWVRPASARPTQEISEEERRYESGQEPNVLDIIEIEMQHPQPHQYQQENHLIDASRRWVKRGVVSWEELQNAVEDPVGPLWLNDQSSSNGTNDKVPESYAADLSRSLYLIRPEGLTLTVDTEGLAFGAPRRCVRSQFKLCGHSYRIKVTDPRVHKSMTARSDGETVRVEALLCVSLGRAFHGHAYKLAAAVITSRRSGG